MNWRVALAVLIMAVWFYLLLNARSDPVIKDLFDSVNPFALAAVTFLFAEPVISERRRRRPPRSRIRRIRDRDDKTT